MGTTPCRAIQGVPRETGEPGGSRGVREGSAGGSRVLADCVEGRCVGIPEGGDTHAGSETNGDRGTRGVRSCRRRGGAGIAEEERGQFCWRLQAGRVLAVSVPLRDAALRSLEEVEAGIAVPLRQITRPRRATRELGWRFRDCVSQCLGEVAKTGSLDRVRFAWSLCPPKFQAHQDTLVAAAHSGSFEVLQFLADVFLALGLPMDHRLCDIAACGGLALVSRFVERGQQCSPDAYSFAADNGRLDVVEYLHRNGLPWSVDCTLRAADSGHFDCLKFFLDHGCQLHERAALSAIIEGHHECALLCQEVQGILPGHLFPCSHFVAAKFGDVAVLSAIQGLDSCSAKCWAIRLRGLALLGNVRVIKFLHEELSCPWDATVCEASAQAGAIKCLKYAHEHGCPWDASLCLKKANRSRQKLCAQYIKLHSTAETAATGFLPG